jgi:hypothetical protein
MKQKSKQKMKRSTSKPRAGMKRTQTPLLPRSATQRYGKTELPVEELTLPGALVEFVGPEPQRDRAHRWSITYPTRQALFKDTPSERRPGTLEEFHPAALEQFEEARQLAMKALDSGVVGEGECVTIISGQGNTDHKPTNGQPNDGLSIAIRQVGS